jgi:hypothetical protein
MGAIMIATSCTTRYDGCSAGVRNVPQDHPAYRQLVGVYQRALEAWNAHAQIREAARLLDMTQREYCDRFLLMREGIAWSSPVSEGSGIDWRAVMDAAHDEARRL